MTWLQQLDKYFDARKESGVIIIRLLVGWRLIDGTQDNILSWARMIEFRDFLAHHHVAYPLSAANLSVYAQFICGLMFITGFYTRLAAIIMIINFIAAIYIVHLGQTFQQAFHALTMLAGAVFFLIHGPGKYSVDEIRNRRKR